MILLLLFTNGVYPEYGTYETRRLRFLKLNIPSMFLPSDLVIFAHLPTSDSAVSYNNLQAAIEKNQVYTFVVDWTWDVNTAKLSENDSHLDTVDTITTMREVEPISFQSSGQTLEPRSKRIVTRKDYQWTELTDEEQQIALQTVFNPPELSPSTYSVLGSIYDSVLSENITIKPEIQEKVLSTLDLLHTWGDWGCPIEKIEAMYSEEADPERSVNELIGVLNDSLKQLDITKYVVKVFDDFYQISNRGKVVELIRLYDTPQTTTA